MVAAGFAAVLIAAETPHVGDINFYGLRKVSSQRILRDVKLRSGAPLPASSGDLQERIAKIPGVTAARVEAVCCDGPNAILFIGIEERGGPGVAFRSEPAGDAGLPDDLAKAYHDYAAAVNRTGRVESDSQTRPSQRQFARFAEEHPDQLKQVIREAAEPEQRAMAATVLGYAPRKQGPVDDLEYALQDPDEQVRANALESLRIFAGFSVRQPSLGLHLSPTWPIELLNSVALNDRLQATDLLVTLTDHGEGAVLDQIRGRALPAVVEMARWPALRYALPAFLVVGRIAGLSDEEIEQRWTRGEREPVIRKALGRSEGKR